MITNILIVLFGSAILIMLGRICDAVRSLDQREHMRVSRGWW